MSLAVVLSDHTSAFNTVFGSGRGGFTRAEPEPFVLGLMQPDGPIPDGLADVLKEKEFFTGGLGRQRILTGRKVFDQQTSAISTGNITCGTMNGVCVRATNTPFFPGVERAATRGQMRDTDIATLRPGAPDHVVDFVREAADYGPCHLYSFFHTTASGNTVLYGFIVTDERHRFLRQFPTTFERDPILDICAPYIAVRP